MNSDPFVGTLAERYGVIEDAVQILNRALERGGGRFAAQFSPREFGGYGQWMPGMTQIEDMFNYKFARLFGPTLPRAQRSFPHDPQ